MKNLNPTFCLFWGGICLIVGLTAGLIWVGAVLILAAILAASHRGR